MEKLKEIIKTFIKWVSVDGLLHIETSMLIYLIVSLPIYLFYGLLFSIPFGFAITFMIGCYKEFYDIYVQKDNTKMQSNHDFICNLIGITLGIIFNILIYIIK